MDYKCQQNLIKGNQELQAILEYICGESNKLYNCATYYARQLYLKTGKIATKFNIATAMVSNPHFSSMYISASQQTCLNVGESFKSFKALSKLYKTNKLETKPSLPKYRKPGFYQVSYPVKWLKLTEKGIRVPLGKKVKCWFGLDAFYMPMPTNLDEANLKELVIIPRNGCFYVNYVYKAEDKDHISDDDKVLAIDHGLDNWLSCLDNLGNSFIVDGRKVKSLNQWYNKRVALLKQDKPHAFWSKKLAAITEKRNRLLRDAVNKAARLVINHCLKFQVGKIIFGWNKGQKDGINIGKKNNQNFVQIPTAKLKTRIEQLCAEYKLEFIETEEAYSSKASFLDNDLVPTYGEKPKEYKFSGKRIKRGLYRSAKGYLVNSDCNGAANIMRKVATRLNLDLSRVSRGVLTTPRRVHFWTTTESPNFN